MPAKFGAGQMRDSVAFDRRAAVDDGYGNEVAGDWVEQFRTRAKFMSVKGSETIMDARLQNRWTALMQVYASSEAEAVTTDWRVRDVRKGTAFNIRDIHGDQSHQLLEMLVEANVNPG